MKYVITNGNVFLKRNKNNSYSITTIQSNAIKYDNLVKVKNILKYIPNKLKDYNMTIQRLSDIPIPKMSTTINIKINIEDKLLDIENFVNYIKDRKEYLQCLLYKENMKILDIEHAAEFYKLDAAKGYKLYKMLRDTRINRRNYKNELEKIAVIEHQGFDMTKVSKMINDIKNLENKRYNPRVLEELFN